MKYLKYLSFLLFACLTLNSCGSSDDEEEIADAESSAGASDVSYTVTNCERVGSVLVVDVTMKNNSKYKMSGKITPSSCNDESGNSYSISNISLFESVKEPAHYEVVVGSYRTIENGKSTSLRFKIPNFDPTNSNPQKFNLYFAYQFSLYNDGGVEVTAGDRGPFDVSLTNLEIKDNRVKSNGIQTPDNGLEFKLLDATLDKDNSVGYLKFSVKNVSGWDIKALELDVYVESDRSPFTDDKGKSIFYTRCGIAVGTDYSTDYYTSRSRTILANETVTYVCKLEGLSEDAKSVSGKIKCSAEDYVLSDDLIRFIDIPFN